MWTFIFLGMGIACLVTLLFLINRFCRFSLLARRKKPVRILLSAALVLGLTAACYVIFDIINLAIILVHTGVIWLLCDGLACLWRRLRPMHRREAAGEDKAAAERTPNAEEDKAPVGHTMNAEEHRSVENAPRRRNAAPAGEDAGRPARYMAGVAALVITAAYLACGWYLAQHVWEKDYEIATDKAVGDLRVVMFADSHVGTTFHGDGFAEQCRRMQETKPDIVVVVGDYVDDSTSREDMIASCEALGAIETTYGVYYAFGNHDKGYYTGRGYTGADLVAELQKNGVHVLQDEVVPIDGRFYLIGRQDRSETQLGRSRASMEELMEGLDPRLFTIVLDHQPHDYAAQQSAGADLVLSGHTHGGQLFPINYLGEWTGENEKTYGLEKRGNTSFLVTSGISDWAIKFKTGCRSEFVVADIHGRAR